MMYLIDLPSLSSLNLEMHSGETVTLGETQESADGVKMVTYTCMACSGPLYCGNGR